MNQKERNGLLDMLAAITEIEEYVGSMNEAGFARDRKTRRAVERCVEVISEASRRVSDETKTLRPEIPWQKIKTIGNIIRHEYGHVDDRIIWQIAILDLAPLKLAVCAMLDHSSPGPEATS